MFSKNKKSILLSAIFTSALLLPSIATAELKDFAFKIKQKIQCPDVNLTKKQRSLMREMRKDFKSQVKNLPKAEKRQRRAEFKQSILDEVPTSTAQREAMKECWAKRKALRVQQRKARKIDNRK